jgi:splicing factor 1
MAPVLTKNVVSDNEDSSNLFSLHINHNFYLLRLDLIKNHGLLIIDSRDSDANEPRRKRKRASRWGDGADTEKTVIPGMPTVLPTNLTQEQEKAYITQLRIEELTRMLRTGDLGISKNQEDRSPSPEPIYDNNGKRLNTREVRTRAKLESERHKHIVEMLKLNPEYKAPADYK